MKSNDWSCRGAMGSVPTTQHGGSQTSLTPLPSTDMHVVHRHACRQNIDKNKSYNYSFEWKWIEAKIMVSKISQTQVNNTAYCASFVQLYRLRGDMKANQGSFWGEDNQQQRGAGNTMVKSNATHRWKQWIQSLCSTRLIKHQIKKEALVQELYQCLQSLEGRTELPMTVAVGHILAIPAPWGRRTKAVWAIWNPVSKDKAGLVRQAGR